MTSFFSYIIWNPDIELFNFLGLPIRYYSLMWCIGLVAAYLLVKKFFKDQKIDNEKFEPLFIGSSASWSAPGWVIASFISRNTIAAVLNILSKCFCPSSSPVKELKW